MLSTYAAVPFRCDVSVVDKPVSSYHYRKGDYVYLGHNTCWGAVLGFTPYTHWSCMRFAKFEVTRTNVWFELWSNLLHLFKKYVKHRGAGGGLNRRRSLRLYHMTESKNGILWANAILHQHSTMKTLKIGTKYRNIWHIPTYLCICSLVSHVLIFRKLMYNVRQTGDMHRCVDGRCRYRYHTLAPRSALWRSGFNVAPLLTTSF